MLWVRAALAAGILTAGMTTDALLPHVGAQQTAASPNNGSYLGIWVWELDASRAKELKVPDGSGVVVTLVSPGSPADQAGVKTGDVISEFNGQKVDGIEQFSRFVRDTPAGRAAKLKIIRNGSTQVLNAKIGAISAAERPGPVMIPPGVRGDGSFPSPERQDVPRSLTTWRSPVLGVDAEPLFGQLAAYFGVSEGVLVRGVAAGSPAEKAGLKAGDVITHVGKHTVNNPAGITAELRMASSSTVKLGVTRDRNPLSLSVTLE